jgi:hypothetical protein
VDGINPCGVTLSSVLSGAQFGETEPNDHIVAADPLITESIFWGQSRSLGDEDWYYLTTIEPNQLLTLNFTVPDRVLVDNTRLSQGWLVSVRDAAGNVYAQFDTRFMLDDPNTVNQNESREITYPVFLGHTGTYYITVEPQISETEQADPNTLSILFWPYNLAAVLEFSGLDSAPPDVNFHDVEIEPNNVRADSNPLATGVTMFGLLRQTTDTTQTNPDGSLFVQTDVDWFRYTSPGNEQIVLAWCGKEACTEDTFWFVEVEREDGTPILSFNSDRAETVRFGLAAPGNYYMQVNFQRSTDAICNVFSQDEFECKQETFECQVLNVTPAIPDDPDTAVDESQPVTCEYGTGNICGTALQSEATASCVRTDLAAEDATDNPVWQWAIICQEFGPVCLEFAPINDLNALNVEYNFTWWGTKLQPLTNGTDAFDEFLERPTWYEDR